MSEIKGNNIATKIGTAGAIAASLAGSAEVAHPGILNQGMDSIGLGILSAQATNEKASPSVPDIKGKIVGEYNGAINIDLNEARFRSEPVIAESLGQPSNIVSPKRLGNLDTKDLDIVVLHVPLIVEGQDASGRGEKNWAVIPTRDEKGKITGYVYSSFSSETSEWFKPDGFGKVQSLATGPEGQFIQPLTGHGEVTLPKPAK